MSESTQAILHLAELHALGDMWTQLKDKDECRSILLHVFRLYHQGNRHRYELYPELYTVSDQIEDVREKLHHLCRLIQSGQTELDMSILVWTVYHQFAHLTRLYLQNQITVEDYQSVWIQKEKVKDREKEKTFVDSCE